MNCLPFPVNISHNLFIFYVFVLILTEVSSGLDKPVDLSCVLKGRPTNQPQQYKYVYINKKIQQCNLLIGGGSIGLVTVSLNSNNIPIVRTGIITITRNNLDKGSKPSLVSQSYVNQLSDKVNIYKPGQIIGYRLGGPGNDLLNIFPQTIENQLKYQQFESILYNCLAYNQTDSVTIRWSFHYVRMTDTVPDNVYYQVHFINGYNNCKYDIKNKIGYNLNDK